MANQVLYTDKPDFPSTVRAPQAADWALSHGIGSLTTVEVADLLGTISAQVPTRLSSAIKRGEWVTPARGLWIPVPPEYRVWSGPPAIEFIDAMMSHMSSQYYLGWLSAAAIHGSAHHAPQVTQVAVSKMIRARAVGRVRLEFFVRSKIESLPTVAQVVRSGKAVVSSVEVTALDLCSDVAIGGGISNVATVLIGLVESGNLSIHRIIDIAAEYSPAAIRRLGWLLDNYTELPEVGELQDLAYRSADTPSLLDPMHKAKGKVDSNWMIRINADVETDE